MADLQTGDRGGRRSQEGRARHDRRLCRPLRAAGRQTGGAPGERLTPTPVTIRQVDRTVAEVAAANDGRYSVELHLRHNRQATDTFAENHVRRLEAIRRGSKAVAREPDGSWTIAPDHLDRAEAYERQRAAQTPVVIETLSTRSIERQAAHDGPTWLDRELVAEQPATRGRGFGADVRKAMVVRLQWLVDQDLAERDGDTIRSRANLLTVLQRRELTRIAGQLSAELGVPFDEARQGAQVTGTYRRSVIVGDAKYALVENSREFTLVPWKPALEHAIGKQVFGIMREDSISWTIGRGRPGPEIGGF